jgi:Leucine-rich repeat (LRR) protein
MKIIKKIIVNLLFFNLCFALNAQDKQVLSEEELAKKPIYSNLAKAYAKHLEVYKVHLKSSGSFYGKIDALPFNIDTLKNLQQFQVVSEALSGLPQKFAKLELMQNLYLGGNKFSTIPEVVFQLKKLKKLDLQKNQITRIPAEIEKLENLEYLYLNDNRNLDFLLIDSFKKLKKLKVITLQNTSLPASVVKDLKKYITWAKIEINY